MRIAEDIKGKELKGRLLFAAITGLAIILVLLAGYFILHEDGYIESWTGRLTDYQKQFSDNYQKRLTEAEADNDAVGFRKLLEEYRELVLTTFDDIARLTPPREYRQLHSATLAYLYSLIEQIDAQLNLYNAARNNQPTDDLREIVDNSLNWSFALQAKLAIAIENAGVDTSLFEASSSTPHEHDAADQVTEPDGEEPPSGTVEGENP